MPQKNKNNRIDNMIFDETHSKLESQPNVHLNEKCIQKHHNTV